MTFDSAYQDRKGFDAKFLRPGKLDGRVPLPKLSTSLAKLATPLLQNPALKVLDYHHYSLVMHRLRRFAIYSAANVDFSGRFKLSRPKDVWRTDPRIAASAQVVAALYTNNQFDRGHLTRREDLEFGADAAQARASADDTCHWTNCTPQHARFNQSAQLWLGLEKHILEQAVNKDSFRAQVITGPVLDPMDPVLKDFTDTPYPLRFWKVVAAINASGQLFATAYVLDQREVIGSHGLRGAPEVPFKPYKTFQTTIAEIERLTGLLFRGGKGRRLVPLSEFDPLTASLNLVGRSTRDVGMQEAAADCYLELGRLPDVYLSSYATLPGQSRVIG